MVKVSYYKYLSTKIYQSLNKYIKLNIDLRVKISGYFFEICYQKMWRLFLERWTPLV